jgi:hypothetical protein
MMVVQRIMQSLLKYAMVHDVEAFQPVACFALVDCPEGLAHFSSSWIPSPSFAFAGFLVS